MKNAAGDCLGRACSQRQGHVRSIQESWCWGLDWRSASESKALPCDSFSTTPGQHLHYPLVHLAFHRPLTHEQDPKILKLLHLGKQLPPNLERAIHCFPAEKHGLSLGGAASHPGHFTLGPVRTGGHGLMKPRDQHHLQKAGRQLWGSLHKHSPHHSCSWNHRHV